MADLLNVEHLSVSFFTPAGEAQAVRDVSFSLKAGEVLAIVGESGCGKSVLCKSILRLLPQTAKIKSGKIIVDGTDITAYREREMTALRGSLFSMVFQDPMWGDRIFEKCGIRRDEGGDGGKTLEIRGKRRLSARDGGANYQQS